MSADTSSREMMSLAYHEAGHAALAVAYGRRLEFVELTPGGTERDGLCLRFAPDDPEVEGLVAIETGQVDVMPDILIALAGRVAEQKAGCDLEDGSDESDSQMALDLACSIASGEDELRRILDGAIDHVRTVLDRPDVWAGVERLAAKLLEFGRVDGHTAHQILTANH